MNPWATWLAQHATARPQLTSKVGWDAFVNTAPRPDFPTLTRAQMGDLSPEELEDYNEARAVWNANLPVVRTAPLTRAYEIIDQVMASSYRDSDRLRGSVVIDAEPGLGKTTIATRYARDYHRSAYRRYGPTTTEGHQFLPVAYIGLSSQITLKGLNQRLLDFYGHPAAHRATSDRLASLLVQAVAACQTRIIVIDDIHFIDFKHRHGMDVSNHLKWLANELPVTFMYVGVNLQARRFFHEGMSGSEVVYAQTARRATRVPLTAFTISTDADYNEWGRLIKVFSAHYKFADADPDMLIPLTKELYRRTQGHIGTLTNLLDHACHVAVRTGTERINAEVLELARADNAAEHRAALA